MWCYFCLFGLMFGYIVIDRLLVFFWPLIDLSSLLYLFLSLLLCYALQSQQLKVKEYCSYVSKCPDRKISDSKWSYNICVLVSMRIWGSKFQLCRYWFDKSSLKMVKLELMCLFVASEKMLTIPHDHFQKSESPLHQWKSFFQMDP